MSTHPARTAHRPRRTRRRLAAALLATATLAAACGSSDDDTSTATTEAPATTAAPTTAPTPSTSAAPATPASWAEVPAGATTPPPRSGAVLAATPDGVLWLHGGHVDDVPLGDLWRFDGTAWTEVTPTGDAPAARSEHVATWDTDRSRLVIALGQGGPTEVFDDVWAFDPATTSWSQLATGGPAARYGACGVHDDADRLVITHGFSLDTRFDDTWAFDLATGTWTDISPAGARPEARCLHACGYDPATGVLHLFGGRSDTQRFLGDTWQLTTSGWQEVATDGPAPRARSRGLFLDAFQVIGGDGRDGLVGDAWTYGAAGWEPGPVDAPARRQAAAVTQTADGTVWLFGGLADGAPLGDLWSYTSR